MKHEEGCCVKKQAPVWMSSPNAVDEQQLCPECCDGIITREKSFMDFVVLRREWHRNEQKRWKWMSHMLLYHMDIYVCELLIEGCIRNTWDCYHFLIHEIYALEVMITVGGIPWSTLTTVLQILCIPTLCMLNCFDIIVDNTLLCQVAAP